MKCCAKRLRCKKRRGGRQTPASSSLFTVGRKCQLEGCAAAQKIGFAGDPVQVKQAADKLAEHGGPGRAGHTPAERRDEQPVKEDVQHAGKGQEVKRVARIPRSPQRAGGKVVEHGGRYAGKHNQDIGARIGKDIRRGAHQRQRKPQNLGQRTPAGQVHRRLGLLHFQSPPGLSFENDEGFAKVCACAPFLQKRRSSCTSPSPA